MDARQYLEFHDLIYTTLDVAFMQHEPDTEANLSFDGDYYDDSLTIFFEDSLPYPYEPCEEIRQAIFDLGFTNVYWVFKKDRRDVYIIGNQLMKNQPDEIRNWEPRHTRFSKCTHTEYGFVDERFNKEHWEKNYKRR